MEVKLSDCIDSNYFVSVDGQYRQLRALVAHLEAKVAELEGTVSHPSCLAIDEARDEERQEFQKLVRYVRALFKYHDIDDLHISEILGTRIVIVDAWEALSPETRRLIDEAE
jgi:hypothetical protein